ncbi:subtilisin-like protease SBT5.6 [Argentina anserina]|uniref:subtilisin-like protease SBT5.6 n=1 Tax=Argentina anserina TaxID=57926 RepID=UPI00217640BC|nr:subtilisin-like protease SBT5.6 [Potentilla anserina]
MKPVFFIIISLLLLPLLASCSEHKVYIVYFGEHSGKKTLHEIEDIHHSYLLSVKETEEHARASLLYSYKHSINGFAAVLSEDEASRLSELEEVVSVWPSHPRKYTMHTTRSWQFVGIEEEEEGNYWKHNQMGGDFLSKAGFGKNIIVGVLDSGVWPESKSFRDVGMGPVPKSWRGICQTGVGFNSSHCNRKLIGARYYLKGFEQHYGPLNVSDDSRSPRDMDGHGTHTSSTVAGRVVPNAAALGGFARGSASGGAPLAHIAVYKVCWAIPGASKAEGNTCFEADMFAAMDDAIADGVDVMSLSIGTSQPVKLTEDGIALGALHAAKKNIVVACSAGNAGPAPSTLSNPAPWIFTVGASSLDRAFMSPVVLGNGLSIEGETVTPSKLEENKMYPLVYAGDVVNPGVAQNLTGQCLAGSLSPEKVKGKIVFCVRGAGMRVSKGMEVKRAGGVGFILGNSKANGGEISVDPHVIPATALSYSNANRLMEYIKSTKDPKATIIPARTVLHTKPAPFMTAFTSRGPSVIDPNILKPDITAPGLNILAAWTEAEAPTKLSMDQRVAQYTIESGTSMSCPHVAAAAALLKAIHPDWSSAAIKSALMTTAGIRNNVGMPLNDESGGAATPFAYGAGHFRPTKAADPGLVYDASYGDYLLYFCSMGVKNFDPTFKCPISPPAAVNLNYPSIAIPKLNGTITIKRTVTNVGNPKSVYFFTSKPPLGISVKASPSILFFDRVGQKKSFTVTVKARTEMLNDNPLKDEYAFGWYTWTDGPHTVRSPIAVSLA